MIEQQFIDECRRRLVQYVCDNAGETFDSFFLGPKCQRHYRKKREELEEDLPSVEEFEKEAKILDNWEFQDNDCEDDGYVGFDCSPYDSQLRGYVYFTNLDITSIEVLGE